MDDIISLKAQFDSIVCHHIYRERNHISDSLSKEAAQHPRGQWMIQEH